MPGLSFAADQITMNVHGDVDSHIDALCHVSYDGTLYNGVPAAAVSSRGAAELSIEGGAHFIKTSTGKTQPGATLQAAEAMIDVIASVKARGMEIGLKTSGGVSSIAEARGYLELYEKRFGMGSATPETFRIGASSLIKPVLAALG